MALLQRISFIAKLRAKALDQGYHPNIWFDNVEVIAAQDIGRKTVRYVSKIIKTCVGYRLGVEQQVRRADERKGQNID